MQNFALTYFFFGGRDPYTDLRGGSADPTPPEAGAPPLLLCWLCTALVCIQD